MADSTSSSLSNLAGSVAKSNLDSEIITQTLDKMNKVGGKSKGGLRSSMSDMYDFNKDVLSAAYEGKGTIADYSKG
ncbi:MAG: hypothetical protein LBV80_05505 [Deltaproteobacteria bacterium]|jgi:hypothetical protein|nr:hypothetical protein [Deltaproteobacteria bacterium]